MSAWQEYTFQSVTGASLTRFVWRPEGQPKAVVQIVHGMAEHIQRYDELAAALTQVGYLVVGHNLLGHGPNAKVLGHFANRGGWDALIADIHTVRTDMQWENPGIPYILLGHSMGSFLTRCYLLSHGKGLKAAVLSGTGDFGKAEVGTGLLLSNLFKIFDRRHRPAKLIDALAFSGNNKAFAPGKTAFDWLSRDEGEVAKYVADPLCGFVFTASGYHDLFVGLGRMGEWENLEAMPKSMPVLFVSGSHDPVGKNGVGMKRVADAFRKAGMEDVTVMLYPEGRHEMFHEINRQDVFADLIAWLDSRMSH